MSCGVPSLKLVFISCSPVSEACFVQYGVLTLEPVLCRELFCQRTCVLPCGVLLLKLVLCGPVNSPCVVPCVVLSMKFLFCHVLYCH